MELAGVDWIVRPPYLDARIAEIAGLTRHYHRFSDFSDLLTSGWCNKTGSASNPPIDVPAMEPHEVFKRYPMPIPIPEARRRRAIARFVRTRQSLRIQAKTAAKRMRPPAS
jgi:hypothetical protein